MNSPFYPGNFYHVFNRGNYSQKIFFNSQNYSYFMRQYYKYLEHVVDTYTFCLLFNHFHFLVRVKEMPELLKMPSFKKMALLALMKGININGIVTNQFRKLFISYSMAVNKQENRTGSLFQKNYKRNHIDDEDHFKTIVYYIHNNPIHHCICDRLETYQWSSYRELIGNWRTKCRRDEIHEWFGGREGFIRFHQEKLDCSRSSKFIIE